MGQRVITALALAVICTVSVSEPRAQSQASVNVFASGLNDPRGITFGPDGFLYVTEAGAGGATLSTVGQCAQVQPPVGPETGGLYGTNRQVQSRRRLRCRCGWSAVQRSESRDRW